MTDQPTQTALDPDPLVNEIRAVAREARRIATEGATAEERQVFNARRRAVLEQVDQNSPEPVRSMPVADLDPGSFNAAGEPV